MPAAITQPTHELTLSTYSTFTYIYIYIYWKYCSAPICCNSGTSTTCGWFHIYSFIFIHLQKKIFIFIHLQKNSKLSNNEKKTILIQVPEQPRQEFIFYLFEKFFIFYSLLRYLNDLVWLRNRQVEIKALEHFLWAMCGKDVFFWMCCVPTVCVYIYMYICTPHTHTHVRCIYICIY